MKPNNAPSDTIVNRVFDPKIWPTVVTTTVLCGIGIGSIMAWADATGQSSAAANYQPVLYSVAQLDAQIPAASLPVTDDLPSNDFPQLSIEISRRPKRSIDFDAKPVFVSAANSLDTQSRHFQRLTQTPIAPKSKTVVGLRFQKTQPPAIAAANVDTLLDSIVVSKANIQPTTTNASASSTIEPRSTTLSKRLDPDHSNNHSTKIIRFQRPAIASSSLRLQPLQGQIRHPKNPTPKQPRSTAPFDGRARGLLASVRSTIDDRESNNQPPQPTSDLSPLPEQAKIETRPKRQTDEIIVDPIKNLSLTIDLPKLRNRIRAAASPDDRSIDAEPIFSSHRTRDALPAVEMPTVTWSFEEDDSDQPPMPKYTSVSGKITLDGLPLSNATIKFLPIARQGKTVSASTDGIGQFTISVAKDARRPGIEPGKYQVRITTYVESSDLNVIDLLETVPEKYNAKTRLSVEIKPDTPNTFNADLTSD